MKIYVDADACPIIRVIEEHHLKGSAKRAPADDKRFAESFERLICHALQQKSDLFKNH